MGRTSHRFKDVPYAPKKTDGETPGKLEPKSVGPAQMLYAKKIAQGKGVVIPDEAKANSTAMSAWIESNVGTKRGKRSRRNANKPHKSTAPKSTISKKRSGLIAMPLLASTPVKATTSKSC
jgi:DNA topoisomerase III